MDALSYPLLVTCSADMTIRTWNPEKGQSLATLSGHTDYVYALALSPDGTLLASGTWNGEIRICNVDKGSLRGVLTGHTAPITSIRWVKSRFVIGGSEDGSVRAKGVGNRRTEADR